MTVVKLQGPTEQSKEIRSICDVLYGVRDTSNKVQMMQHNQCAQAVTAEVNAGATTKEVRTWVSGNPGKGFLIAGAAAAIGLTGLGWWLGGRKR